MPASLENIKSPVGVKDVPRAPDEQTRQESSAYKAALIKAQIDDFKQDTSERKKYANRIFCLVVGWLLGVAVLLLIFHSLVTERVLIALLSGTTINVLGIFVVVAKYLFPHRNKH
jgi:hypothetical protein